MVDVLVVDDDVDIREALRMLLEDEGYLVFEAPDGKSALERMREHLLGMVVLLDLMMPGMGGLAVMQAVTVDPSLALRHRIILVTAIPDDLPGELGQVLAQLGACVLGKPFSLDGILGAVEHAAALVA